MTLKRKPPHVTFTFQDIERLTQFAAILVTIDKKAKQKKERQKEKKAKKAAIKLGSLRGPCFYFQLHYHGARTFAYS